jgi:hypothetical protein
VFDRTFIHFKHLIAPALQFIAVLGHVKYKLKEQYDSVLESLNSIKILPNDVLYRYQGDKFRSKIKIYRKGHKVCKNVAK